MKLFLIALAASAVLTYPAMAQEPEQAAISMGAFNGLKVGVTADLRRLEAKYDAPVAGARVDKQTGGAGFRAWMGYDRLISGEALLGVEAGAGRGGQNIAANLGGSEYKLKQDWNWDVSARAGFLPDENVLIYARAGYGWLQTHESLRSVVNDQMLFQQKKIRGGLMYGFGVEYGTLDNFSLRAELNQTDLGHGLKSARAQFGGALRF